MFHEPAPVSPQKDHATAIKARIGIILFWIYCFIYAGFVAVNTFNPTLMESNVIFGLNLAVTYGVGLILLAVVLGLAYNHVCTQLENRMNKPAAEKEC